MRVIDHNRNPVPDSWAPYNEGGVVTSHTIFPIEFFLATRVPISDSGMGVVVPPEKPVDLVAPLLRYLALVCIDFPKFRDGRGFTLAHRLRWSYGFAGDIRAVGHILPDQFQSLISCGFSTVLTPLAHPPERWRPSLPKTPEGEFVAGPLLVRMMNHGRARPGDGRGRIDG